MNERLKVDEWKVLNIVLSNQQTNKQSNHKTILKMKKNLITSTIILFLAFSVTGRAQAQNDEKGFIAGNTVNFMFPQGSKTDTYNFGWGIYANMDYNFNKHLAARLDVGWNTVTGPETTYADSLGFVYTDTPKMSLWEFTAGLKASVSVVYIEVRGGYFTGINSWGFVPAVGLRIGRFDIQGSYTMAGDDKWISGRIGFYWAK